MSTFLVNGQEVTKPQARALAADLLAFAGPERPMVFHHEDNVGDTLRVWRAPDDVSIVVYTEGQTVLRAPKIDALIAWLQGHREAFPG